LNFVRVTAAARLHLGFLDLNGGLGRRFGSIGLSVDAFETEVRVRESKSFAAFGEERSRAAALAHRLAKRLGLDTSLELTVARAIPAHAGLGSGTQLALSVASAMRRLAGLPIDPREDASLLDRGERSGAGAALFERGGIVVDAGRAANTIVPPVIARLAFPAEWRIILILEPEAEGVHGEAEREAFSSLPPFPEILAAQICRLTLMQILPAVAEEDIGGFGSGVERVQEIVGDHFAPAQGGRFAGAQVRLVAERLKACGARGIGQSSWGPTGFAFAVDHEEAEFLARTARADCPPGIEIKVCRALNQGAEIVAGSRSVR
jgi:beta-RFAP synthase